jgi:hypothetical protein
LIGWAPAHRPGWSSVARLPLRRQSASKMGHDLEFIINFNSTTPFKSPTMVADHLSLPYQASSYGDDKSSLLHDVEINVPTVGPCCSRSQDHRRTARESARNVFTTGIVVTVTLTAMFWYFSYGCSSLFASHRHSWSPSNKGKSDWCNLEAASRLTLSRWYPGRTSYSRRQHLSHACMCPCLI